MTDPVRLTNNTRMANGPHLRISTKGADMDAFDQLGMACQMALRHAVLPWSAETFLEQHRKRGWNPKDPRADAALAAEFAEIDRKATIETASEGHPIHGHQEQPRQI